MPVAAIPSGIRTILERADVRLDGSRPWDLDVRDDRLFARVMAQGTLGFGEAYMDGWWECGRIDELVFRLVRAGVLDTMPRTLRTMLFVTMALGGNLQSRGRAVTVARRHYDLGNAFFQAFLDPLMQYSCAYFGEGDGLAAAQRRKLDLIRRKLNVGPDDHLLDIGCGWGGLAKFMATEAGCRVTGVNISAEQIAFAKSFCRGLPVEILKRDYRDSTGMFTKVVSVGMFEHVGSRNYRTYMETAHRSLRDGGLFLLHTIGSDYSSLRGDPWLHAYIFPNGQLPSAGQIPRAAEGLFTLEDWHNFGPQYDHTLLAWHRNVEEAWPQFQEVYGERFHRMWRYYLLSCAGMFRARAIQLWQIVLSKRPEGEYVGVR